MDLNPIIKNMVIYGGVFKPYEGTMLFAETALEYPGRFLDLGTGSGFLTIVLYKNGNEGDASDISNKALKCAKENFERAGIKVNLIQSDFYSNIQGKYDLILFNPPVEANETESYRMIKNILKRSFLKGICSYLSLIIGRIHAKKRREKLAHFIEQTRDHLEKQGVLLMLMLKSDVDWFKANKNRDYRILEKKGTIKHKVKAQVVEITYQ